MLINTMRFGQLQIDEADLVSFPEGLLGFNHLRQFILLDDPNDEIFAWLQSCEDSNVAFPILEPELFVDNYKIAASKSDLETLKLKSLERVRYFCIITIPDDPTQMTANLKAPLIINIPERIGKQCVLQDNDLAIREPIFSKLQQKIVRSLPIRSQAVETGIAISLKPETPAPDLQK